MNIPATAYDRIWPVQIGSANDLVSVPDPFSADEENKLSWYFEEHAMFDAFSLRRAKAIRRRLTRCHSNLTFLLRPALRQVLEHSVLETEVVWCIIMHDGAVETSIHEIHWAALEQERLWGIDA